METLKPSVIIDGRTVYPEGWMYILAFALKGIPWAIATVESPEFDLRGKLKDYYKRRDAYFLESDIAYYEKKLNELKSELKMLKSG